MSYNHVTKLYELLTKVMLLLEDEIDVLESSKTKNSLTLKRSVAEMLNKLATLLAQLNKLSKDEKLETTEVMNDDDKEIISRFIQEYKASEESIPKMIWFEDMK